jgi:hypothetical protein
MQDLSHACTLKFSAGSEGMERAFTSMIVTGSPDFFLFVPFSLLLFGFFQKQASSMHQEEPRGD